MAHPILTRDEIAEACPWLADPDWVDPVDLGAELSYDPDPPDDPDEERAKATHVVVTALYWGRSFRLKIPKNIWLGAWDGYKCDQDYICLKVVGRISGRKPNWVGWEEIGWTKEIIYLVESRTAQRAKRRPAVG